MSKLSNPSSQTRNDEELTFFQKSLKFYKLGIPSMLCSIVMFAQEIMNLICAGHMTDPAIMAGIGLGNMT